MSFLFIIFLEGGGGGREEECRCVQKTHAHVSTPARVL